MHSDYMYYMYKMAGKLKLADIPVMNFGQFMVERMKQFGDAIALVDGLTDKVYTYNDVIYRTKRLAAGLQGMGVTKGDVVGVVSHNNIDYVTVVYATALITTVVQPINPLYTPADLTRVFRECGTKVVFVEPQFVSKVNEAVSDIPYMKIVVFGESAGCISFESLFHRAYGDHRTPPCDPKTTTMALLSSSGTTGFPKAAQLSHYCIIANSFQLQGSELFRRDDRCILYLPMFHVYGLYVMCVTAHFAGCQMVVIPKFDAETYFRLIEKYKLNYLHNVPPVMVMLAKHPKVSEYDLTSVTRVMSGAAPLSEEIERVVKERLNVDHITLGFGMTEVGVIFLSTDTAFRHHSIGKPLQLTEVKIVDVDTGKTLGLNEEGEIWMRGPQVGLGYLNLPAETRHMFLPDGWARTGDIGYEDEDGYFYVVDRIKEIIKYKGYQVAPATLENILLRHEAVRDAAVIGVPDEAAGELPRAYVVIKAGKQTDASEIQQFVAKTVAPHMKLRGGVEFVSDIPRSAAGKILRRVIRDRANITRSKY